MWDFRNAVWQRTTTSSSTAITIELHTRAEHLYKDPESILYKKKPVADNICEENHLLSLSMKTTAGYPLITLNLNVSDLTGQLLFNTVFAHLVVSMVVDYCPQAPQWGQYYWWTNRATEAMFIFLIAQV